jgi:hypothetical protein
MTRCLSLLGLVALAVGVAALADASRRSAPPPTPPTPPPPDLSTVSVACAFPVRFSLN